MEKIKRLNCTNNSLKNSNQSFFRIGSCCQHAWYKPIFIGCMKWQHAVILEPIWETDLIKTFLRAERIGLLTPLLTWFTLLPFSLSLSWTIFYSKSFSSSLSSSDKVILSQCSLSTLLFPGKKTLSPTPCPQKYSKTFSFSILAADPFQFYKIILSPIIFRTWKNSFFCWSISYSWHWSVKSVH